MCLSVARGSLSREASQCERPTKPHFDLSRDEPKPLLENPDDAPLGQPHEETGARPKLLGSQGWGWGNVPGAPRELLSLPLLRTPVRDRALSEDPFLWHQARGPHYRPIILSRPCSVGAVGEKGQAQGGGCASTDWEMGPSQVGRREEWGSTYNQGHRCPGLQMLWDPTRSLLHLKE